jgi:hypothetical protein
MDAFFSHVAIPSTAIVAGFVIFCAAIFFPHLVAAWREARRVL